MGIPPWEVEEAPIYWIDRILAYMEGEHLHNEWEAAKHKK